MQVARFLKKSATITVFHPSCTLFKKCATLHFFKKCATLTNFFYLSCTFPQKNVQLEYL
jgi:hypothetical protein